MYQVRVCTAAKERGFCHGGGADDAPDGRADAGGVGAGGRGRQVAWSADSRLLVSASKDSTMKVWDVRARKMKEDLPGHADEVFAVDWSPDGARVASGGRDRVLKLYVCARVFMAAALTWWLTWSGACARPCTGVGVLCADAAQVDDLIRRRPRASTSTS